MAARKLGEVARPRHGGDERERRLRERAGLAARRSAQRFFEEARRDHRHVLLAVAQRRQIDADGREPAEQIGAEPVRVDVGVDRRRRAGDEANVGRDRLAVERHFAVARDAREARLDRRGQLGHVLQEQRAAARRGDAAVACDRFEIGWRRRDRRRAEGSTRRTGAARCATASAPSHSTTTYRRGRATTSRVQLARDGFDVRAALGREEHADVERRGAANQLLHARDRRRMADELECTGRLLAEAGVRSPGGCLLERRRSGARAAHQCVCHKA